jgi:glycosyltransferase involved in cell wall biosynthesis
LTHKDKLDLPKKMIIIGENNTASVDPAVTFTGYVDDQTLVDLLAGAEAFVYPSLYEGFGLPILEAFYHQVAVVASNASAIPEVVGEAGVLFDPYDEADIAKGIKQAIESKTELTKKGQARLANYTWEKTAAQTLAVYKSLC